MYEVTINAVSIEKLNELYRKGYGSIWTGNRFSTLEMANDFAARCHFIAPSSEIDVNFVGAE